MSLYQNGKKKKHKICLDLFVYDNIDLYLFFNKNSKTRYIMNCKYTHLGGWHGE